ncbi:hypothetical protein KSF_001600 [Reticulibacter mediterranei]|uniref:Uncharacterized protein n=1 Tax=Reticulibacter mediterranei TaxID=2778369 RepID=A0A8J3MXR6_9CHLR|nr:hypothetical protein [Reticulibacter mediterranei]GHO90112.1 hypothetical protein KSF_001600 [Reticulibacter mediterranei]
MTQPTLRLKYEHVTSTLTCRLHLKDVLYHRGHQFKFWLQFGDVPDPLFYLSDLRVQMEPLNPEVNPLQIWTVTLFGSELGNIGVS